MDIAAITKQLELAMQLVLAPPQLVSNQQRHDAEEILLNFRKSKEPYNVCRAILENSTLDAVMYQAATTLKEAMIREWSFLEEQTRSSLQQFIFDYLINRPKLSNYVRDIMTQVLAIAIKIASVNEKQGSTREPIYQHLTQLFATEDPVKQLLVGSILHSLCMEFAVTTKSSDVSITWEQHIKCKRQFEAYDIHKIFDLVLKILHHTIHNASNESNNTSQLLAKFLAIAHQILCWNFLNTGVRRSVIVYDDTSRIAFKPDIKWKKVILDPNVLALFFQVAVKCRKNQNLSHLASQCVSQLATVQGVTLKNLDEHSVYLYNFLQHFLHIYGSDWHNYEALNIANTFSNILEYHKLSVWSHNPQLFQLFDKYLDLFTKFTSYVCVKAAEDEMLDDDEQCFSDAFDVLLNTWTSMIEMMGPAEIATFITDRAFMIFQQYVHCHIAEPTGCRVSIDYDAEEDELNEEDRLKYSSVLISVACLARTNLTAVFPFLIPLIEGKIDQYAHILESNENVNEKTCQDLYEDLHWLIMLSGYILSDDCSGESALIPHEIVSYSVAQSKICDQQNSMVVMCSPEHYRNSISTLNTTDHVVRLISNILRLAHVLTSGVKVNKASHISPQVYQDVVWCLYMITQSYLIFQEDLYDEISPSLSLCFGQDSDGGQWFVHFIVNVICTIFSMWTAEISLLDETGHLIINLVDSSRRCALLTTCGEFWQFSSSFCRGEINFSILPPIVRRKIMSAIITVGSSTMAMYKDKYIEQTFEPVKQRYMALVTKPDFKSTAYTTGNMDEMLAVLDLMWGIAEASSPANANKLFTFLSTILQEASVLVQVYNQYQTVVISLLELFAEVAHGQICFLHSAKCNQLYKWSLDLLKSYSGCFRKQGQQNKEEEEDAYQDISLLIELFTNLLSKDFIDFSDGEEETSKISLINESTTVEKVEVSDVVLFGLEIILPHINSELLSIYFKLVTYMCELYPEKVEKLSDGMLQAFMHTLQLGLSSYGLENCKMSLEGIVALGERCVDTRDTPTRLHVAMQPFIRAVFDVVLVHSGDMQLLQSSSEAFYVMCRFAPQLVNEMLKAVVMAENDVTLQQRLSENFAPLLTPEILASPQRNKEYDKQKAFCKRLEEVVLNVRGILCVK